jgi:drug/metabolite transporter superfamily protein YnfA
VKVETPLLVPVLAALPVCACMAILALPSFGHGYSAAFRTLYFVACLAWLVPLARTYMPALAEALHHLNKNTA